MNTLFVPSIGLDVSLLERLAASIDYPIARKIVMNNGPEDALEKFGDTHPDWNVVEPACGNLGVAGSWNWIAKMFPEESILIMNEDAWFLPGYLEEICAFTDKCKKTAPIIYLNDSNAYYCFVWTKYGREQLGTFDENFWPAYYEDCDYRVRHRLWNRSNPGAIHQHYVFTGFPPLPHGKPRTGGINYTAMLQGCGLLNRAYWRKKWGCELHGRLDFEKAEYQTPYKDHRLGVHEWVWDPAHRAKLYALWECFMSLPNPSIYE